MADIPLDAFDEKGNEFGSKPTTPNKRPVGRPPGSGARRGRPPRRATAAQKIDPNQVYQTVGFAIVLADQLAAATISEWEKQRLTQTEVGALAKGIGDEALTNERIALWLSRVSTSNVHVQLVSIIAAIALPRMAAAGMLPEDIANAVAVQVGTRTTPFAYRDDREREVNFSGEDNGASPVRSNIPKQVGQSDVSEYDYSENGAGNGEFSTEPLSPVSPL